MSYFAIIVAPIFDSRNFKSIKENMFNLFLWNFVDLIKRTFDTAGQS